MCDDYEGAMACEDTCFFVHVLQHEEGASQRSVSAEVWTVKVVVCGLYDNQAFNQNQTVSSF